MRIRKQRMPNSLQCSFSRSFPKSFPVCCSHSSMHQTLSVLLILLRISLFSSSECLLCLVWQWMHQCSSVVTEMVFLCQIGDWITGSGGSVCSWAEDYIVPESLSWYSDCIRYQGVTVHALYSDCVTSILLIYQWIFPWDPSRIRWHCLFDYMDTTPWEVPVQGPC